jgi:hypothetical protein
MKTISKSGLSVKTAIKAGGLNSSNHNRSGLKIKSAVKAGGLNSSNHNRSGLKVKAGIRAGLTPLLSNHNTRVLRAA